MERAANKSGHESSRQSGSRNTRKGTVQNEQGRTVALDAPDAVRGELKTVGGSQSDRWNYELVNQAARTVWRNSDEQSYDCQVGAIVDAMAGIKPKDEIEGMIAAQLLAAHNAAMECYRRAMLREQTFEGRREALSQANKLSRTSGLLVETLNRHRGKGQQKVTVEHVHVHSGGQAIVGTVERPTPANSSRSENQQHAKQITHAPQPAMRGPDKERDLVPSARDAERPLSNARRTISGSTEGK
jgi:hypothetical protein